jgi:transcriptional regulator with XRE-family HTH domain
MTKRHPRNFTGMDWLRFRMTYLGDTSLQQVADRVGINRGNLYRYFQLETRPSIDVVPLLADALGVTVMEILRALEVDL